MSDDTSVSYFESFAYNDNRVYAFNCIKKNDPDFKRLVLYPYDPVLPVEEWLQLGNNIGRNTHLEGFLVCPDAVTEEDDIASTENLELFIGSIANNRSLKHLIIEEYDFSRARLEVIHPFIIENDNLEELELLDCGFGQHDLQMLAAAFSQRRNPTSIKHLGIAGSNMDDESVPIIVEICGYCPRLQRLDLIYCRHTVGIQGWTHLATFLQDPKCSVERLDLALNDEGARVLADALVHNNKLKTLAVFDWQQRSPITSIGWGYFHSILRSTSNVDATSSSNHSLERLWNPMFKMPDGLPEELLFCLKVNEEKDKKKVIRRKIFHYHLNDNEKLSSLIGTDQEILPNLLGWIGKDYNTCSYDDKIIRKTAFYRIIRSYPDLCGFETYDRKMRNQLEAENTIIKAEVATLKAENATIKSEVVTLKTENEELLRKIEQLTRKVVP